MTRVHRHGCWLIIVASILLLVPTAWGQFQSMAPMIGRYALREGMALRLPAVCVRETFRTPLASDAFRATRSIWLREIDSAGNVLRQVPMSDAIKHDWTRVPGLGDTTGIGVVPTDKLPPGNWRIDVEPGAVVSSSEEELAEIGQLLDRPGAKATFNAINEDRKRLVDILGAESAGLHAFDRLAVKASWDAVGEEVPDIAKIGPGKGLRNVLNANGINSRDFAGRLLLMHGEAMPDGVVAHLAELLRIPVSEFQSAVPKEVRDRFDSMCLAIRDICGEATLQKAREGMANACIGSSGLGLTLEQQVELVIRDHYGVSDVKNLSRSYVRYLGHDPRLVEQHLKLQLPEGPALQNLAVVIDDSDGLRAYFNGQMKRLSRWDELPPTSEWQIQGLVSEAYLSRENARLLARRNIHLAITPDLIAELHGKKVRVVAVMPQDLKQAEILFPGQNAAQVLEEAQKWKAGPGIEIVSTKPDLEKILDFRKDDEHFIVIVDNAENAGISDLLEDLGVSSIRCDNFEDPAAGFRSTGRIYADSLRESLSAGHLPNDGGEYLKVFLTRYTEAERVKGRRLRLIAASTGGFVATGGIVLFIWDDCCDCDNCECDQCDCDESQCCNNGEAKIEAKDEKKEK